jgi:superfamily II DNA or RNA helicase
MARSVRLRPWQKRALDKLATTESPDFLAVATPGAGKTTFALTAAVHELAANRGRRLVVVAPTSHLKLQWADAAERFGLHLEPSWAPGKGALPLDVHGLVTTYQQVASSPDPLRAISARGMVILDEIHHAGDDRAWGSAVRHAFEPAAKRLSLSGTPFRSDTQAIPFVNYVGDEARPDFEYGYGQALEDGRVVRPVYFPRINGFMEWITPDGNVASAAFDDALDKQGTAQRLRTALSLEGEWLPAVLTQANDRLSTLRRHHPEAGGLVIASDQDHARGIANLLRYRCGVKAAVALSDDPRSSTRIAKFSGGSDPWIVAVRMISEGVDIPRLRIGVYATTTATELFFRQAVGRFVRWTRGVPRQKAYLFIPDDARLRVFATQMADSRRHSLAKPPPKEGDEYEDDIAFDRMVHEDDLAAADQLSLFAPLSAVVTGAEESSVFEVDDDALARLDRDDHDAEAGVEVTLPPLAGSPVDARDVVAIGLSSGGQEGLSLSARQRRLELRERNGRLVQDIVWATGQTHQQVNARLNQLVGLRRIDEATVDQLARRVTHAERWLKTGSDK